MLSIKSFNADDAHNEPWWYTIGLLSLHEQRLVTLPKLKTCLNALGFDKAGTVGRPIFLTDLGWRQDQLGNTGNQLGLCQLRFDPLGV